MHINNVGSGIKYDEILTLVLIDHDNQTMILESQDVIQINPVNFSTSSILGTNFALLRSGIAIFNDLTFISEPGAENVKFRASASVIDSRKIIDVFGSQLNTNDVVVSFRF